MRKAKNSTKKIWAAVMAAAVLLLTACSAGTTHAGRGSYSEDDALANGIFEKLVDAVEKRDGEAVRALFSKNALKDAKNMEEATQALFGYVQGEMVPDQDWGRGGVSNEMAYSEYQRSFDASYDFETTQDKYRVATKIIMADDADEDNVGLMSLYIIRFADDTDQENDYWGDGKYTPGINIGKTK